MDELILCNLLFMHLNEISLVSKSIRSLKKKKKSINRWKRGCSIFIHKPTANAIKNDKIHSEQVLHGIAGSGKTSITLNNKILAINNHVILVSKSH